MNETDRFSISIQYTLNTRRNQLYSFSIEEEKFVFFLSRVLTYTIVKSAHDNTTQTDKKKLYILVTNFSFALSRLYSARVVYLTISLLLASNREKDFTVL